MRKRRVPSLRLCVQTFMLGILNQGWTPMGTEAEFARRRTQNHAESGGGKQKATKATKATKAGGTRLKPRPFAFLTAVNFIPRAGFLLYQPLRFVRYLLLNINVNGSGLDLRFVSSPSFLAPATPKSRPHMPLSRTEPVTQIANRPLALLCLEISPRHFLRSYRTEKCQK